MESTEETENWHNEYMRFYWPFYYNMCKLYMILGNAYRL